MVGPVDGSRRRRSLRQLAAGFVVLVAVSAAGTAVYGGATGVEAGAAGAVGLLTGVVILVLLGARP